MIFFVVKSYIKSRLINERLNNFETWGKFETFLKASCVAVMSYFGIFMLAVLLFDELSFIPSSVVFVSIVVVAVSESIYLSKIRYYEKTKSYLENADIDTIKKERKPVLIFASSMGSIFLLALLIYLIKGLLDN